MRATALFCSHAILMEEHTKSAFQILYKANVVKDKEIISDFSNLSDDTSITGKDP
jgi:hypothetical protein